MKPPSPPIASEIPFTICSIILGIPAMKLMKAAMRNQHSLSIALLIVENMASKTAAIRSLKEVMTDSMITEIDSVRFARFDYYNRKYYCATS